MRRFRRRSGNEKRLICWDLDNTLVYFIKHDKMGIIGGVRPMIEGLRKNGIRHVITTAAPDGYPQYVLSTFGMSDLFDGIFSRDDLIRDDSYTKHYSNVAHAFGISPADAEHQMLVIGNNERDASIDLDLTFIMHPFSEKYSARGYASILTTLSNLSHSWKEAHSILMQNISGRLLLPYFQGGVMTLDGIALAVGYSYWNPGSIRKPTRRFIGVLELSEKPAEIGY